MAHFGHAAIAELSPVSGIRRKLDFEPAKGSFWRKAVVDLLTGISPTHEAKISIKTLRASGARGWEMFTKPPIYA
jgi:hypothetical protein